MYVRHRKCLLVVLAFGFLLFCCSTYLISNGDGTTEIGFGAQTGNANRDMFINDHIDVPEIPVGKKALNNSDYEKQYKEELNAKRSRSKLLWHNNIKQKPEKKQHYNENTISSDEIDEIRKASLLELERFKEYFKQWPQSKPKAAFYVLTGESRVKRLQTMLHSVDKYFNDQFHYPVIVFHEASFARWIPTVREWTNSTLFFQLVAFEIPEFLSEPVKVNIPCTSAISYRHMCRFNAKGVYEEATIRALEYYWRLDDDSQLLAPPIRYDVFAYMRRARLHYGYSWLFYDAEACVTGLWEATARYVRRNADDLRPTFFADWPRPRLYYNNFEIASTGLWLSRAYREYIDYLDRLGGIYYHRWGDAPIHGIAVSLFLHKNETHLFSDIGYKHNTYVHKAVLQQDAAVLKINKIP